MGSWYVTESVLQGSVLSPVLFVFYVKEILCTYFAKYTHSIVLVVFRIFDFFI